MYKETLNSMLTKLTTTYIMYSTLLSLLAGTAVASTSKLVVSQDAALIDGPIDKKSLDPVAAHLDSLYASGKRTADIILNSPGGSVVTGFLFVSKMEQLRGKGMTLRCFVPKVAASMAFQILLHCDEKYVLDRSFVLWHRVRVMLGGLGGEPITSVIARHIYKDLLLVDKVIIRELRTKMPRANHKEVMYHFEQESLLAGESAAQISAGSIISLPYIENLLEVLESPKTTKSQAVLQVNLNQILYMQPLGGK
jgi:ATP-dependent protease ClpP protease subunit